MYEISEVRGIPVSTKSKHFICDTVADIANLPTDTVKGTSPEGQEYETETVSIGSTALVMANSSVWMLSPSGVWKEI